MADAGRLLPDIRVLKVKRERLIVKAFDEGYPIGEIARADGSGEARIRSVLRAHGVELD